MAKRDLNETINRFLGEWDCDRMVLFLQDIEPILSLYDVDEDVDWVREQVGEADLDNVRLLRTVYLISKFAEHHGASLCMMKVKFPQLWKWMEEEGRNGQTDTEDQERSEAC